MDLVLVGSAQARRTRTRVKGLLRRPPPWSSAFVLEDAEGPSPWAGVDVLGGGRDVAAVNRALLLGRDDVLVIGSELTAGLEAAGRLEQALAHGERLAMVVPVVAPTRTGEGDLATLPPLAELPGPDVECVLLRREIIALIGGLDGAFATLLEALCDWSLRARRLGFTTARANQVVVTSRTPARFPESPMLEARHRIWSGLRQGHERAFDFERPHRALRHHGRPLSVCLDLRSLPYAGPTGTGVYALRLAENLLRHTPIRLCAVVAHEAQRAQLPEGLAVSFDSEPPPEAQIIHRPAQVFSRGEFAWLLRFPGALVVTFQDLIAYQVPSLFDAAEDHAGYRTLSRMLLQSAQAVVAISAHNQGEMVREFALDPRHVPLVHHGVDAAWFGEDDPAANRALLRSAGVRGRYFLAVGSDYPHKNHRVLFAAYAQLRARWPTSGKPPELVLAGPATGVDGSGYSGLRAHPLPGVRYLGPVPGALVRALYQQSLGLVYPSVYEGFGLPLLEAMASGVPVVCSRHACLAEVGGEAPRYVHPMTDQGLADTLLGLARSSALRKAAAALGRARVATFSWERAAKETYAAYQQAVADPAPASFVARHSASQQMGW